MQHILELKNIFETLDLEESQKKRVVELLDNIESDVEEINFIAKRYQHDQIVNESFIKKTLNLLEKTNEKLKQSNDILIETNNELSNSNIELERFAYMASHDLKTPLYNIIRFSGLLKHNIELNNNSNVLEYLSFIIDGGSRMNNLIESILAFSNLSKENINNKQVFNLENTIENISLSISEHLKIKKATVEVLTPLPTFNWYPSKFFILFKNLIENGIKYNESINPTVKIYCKVEQSENSVFIEDNGIGIEEDYFDKIFEMFTRLHNHGEYKGTGLGLAICKKIVTEFEGEINIESHLDTKTIFKIDFPIQLIENTNPVPKQD